MYCRLTQLISVQPCDGVWKSSLSGAASIQPGTQTGCYYKLPTQQSHPITFNYCLGCCFSMHTCKEASVPQKESAKKTSMRHRNTYSQRAAGAERYCMLCRQRHFAHMHVHAPHCSRACWPSCGRAKKHQLTKNSSHCDRSTDIYSLVAQSCPAAYSCVCACHNRKSKRGDSSFLWRVHLTKTGSSVKMLQSARHWAVAMTTIKAWRPANKQLGCSEALKKQSPHTHSPHATQVYDHKSICVQCVASSLDVSNFLEMICCTPEVHVISLRS